MNCRRSWRSKPPPACPPTWRGSPLKPGPMAPPRVEDPDPMTLIRTLFAFLAVSLLAVVAPAASAAITQDDLLPVDEAFVLTATAPARDRIEIRWKITDGYYLYR